MAQLPFYIVDVFAETKYAGNQLAVVRGAAALSDDEMLQIAREMNYSETTFLLSDEERDGGYDVRIFTPAEEVPFAGHPTLGTAYIIRHELIGRPVERVVLNLKVGQIPVVFNEDPGGRLWMRQMPPRFGRTFDATAVSAALNLKREDIDERFPIQEVSTGLPFIICPLRTLDAVRRARTDRERFFALVEDAEAKAILIFAPETYEQGNHLNARVFIDYYGLPEDPATGSANGCLAGYLVQHRYFGGDRLAIRVEQGYEIARPSLLLLRAGVENGQIAINVGGRVVMVARGAFV